MPEWVYSVIAVVVVTAIVMFFVNKRKNDEWEGELIKKRSNPGDMETQPTYTLVFKIDEGKKKRQQVSLAVYDDWEIGDRAKKEKGEFNPKRVE